LNKPIVIKMGGATFDSADTTVADFVKLQKEGKPLVVIHGGGKMVTEWLKRQGVETRFVNGERVTSAEGLEVSTAVLAGLANKQLASVINNAGGRAVGISGVDGLLIQSRVKNEELGYVGEVIAVDVSVITALLEADFIPVISPISYNIKASSGSMGSILNVNGDPAAGEIARALSAEKLIFFTDVDGVLDENKNVINEIFAADAEQMITKGVVVGGMIPKIRACVRAKETVGQARIINGTRPHALLAELSGEGKGTTID